MSKETGPVPANIRCGPSSVDGVLVLECVECAVEFPLVPATGKGGGSVSDGMIRSGSRLPMGRPWSEWAIGWF